MKKITSLLLIFLFLILLTFISTNSVLAYYTNMSASVVVGQPDFSSNSSNQGGSVSSKTLSNPGHSIIAGNKLIVSDGSNHRVLIWNSVPTTNNAPADVVIGQADFVSNSLNQGGGASGCTANTLRAPGAPFSDGTRLFIPDQSNHRVLIYNTIPTTNNAAADVVIGHSTFTTCTANNGGSVAANTLNVPDHVWLDGSKLIVSDAVNNRILIYNQVPTLSGTSADVVVGQQDFLHNSANQGGSVSASTLKTPVGAATYNGKLIISDRDNNRILIYNSIPTTNNVSADAVVGQPDFISSSSNQGGTAGANTLFFPQFPYIYNDRLFIPEDSTSSSFNNRILIFNSLPSINNASANIVIGQPDFTSGSANQGGAPASNTINRATGVFANSNKMVITDRINSRILIFNNVIATPEISVGSVIKTSDLKLKISGNVKMGEAAHYDLGLGGGISYSINGSDGVGINTIGNQVSDGNGSLYYDFSNTFEPWTGSNGTKDEWISNFDTLRSSRGFTVKISSKNSNTDSSRIFYFEPFNMTSLLPGTATFTVNKYQTQRIKDNIDHFEIQTKKGNENWKTYLSTISTDKLTSDGTISALATNALSIGNYQVKAVAVSKDSNWRQYSSTITTNLSLEIPSVSYINPNNYTLTTGQWFPLQVNSLTPDISGISFANTTVAIRITDTSGKQKDYYTITDRSSRFVFKPVIYGNSLLTISTYDTNGRYNELPPIQILR